MEIFVKITVSEETYRFYAGASRHVADCSPEKLMSDALAVYTQMVLGKPSQEGPDRNSSVSRSR